MNAHPNYSSHHTVPRCILDDGIWVLTHDFSGSLRAAQSQAYMHDQLNCVVPCGCPDTIASWRTKSSSASVPKAGTCATRGRNKVLANAHGRSMYPLFGGEPPRPGKASANGALLLTAVVKERGRSDGPSAARGPTKSVSHRTRKSSSCRSPELACLSPGAKTLELATQPSTQNCECMKSSSPHAPEGSL